MNESNAIGKAVLDFVETYAPPGVAYCRVTPDLQSPLGWSSTPRTGTTAGGLRREVAAAEAAFRNLQPGEVVKLPVGFHPRHGMKTETWIRVR